MPNMYIYNAKKSMNIEQMNKLSGSNPDSGHNLNSVKDKFTTAKMIVEDDMSAQIMETVQPDHVKPTIIPSNPYLYKKPNANVSIDIPNMIANVHDSDGTDTTSSCDNSVHDVMTERMSVVSNNSDTDDYGEDHVLTTSAMKVQSAAKKASESSEGNFNDYSNIYIRSNKKAAQKKRKRTNYKDPKNAEKLQNALNVMLCRSNIDMRQLLGKSYVDDEGNEIRKTLDLKTVSKLFDVPYNTLRDNYLKITQGSVIVKESTRARKLEMEAMQRTTDVKTSVKPTLSKEAAFTDDKQPNEIEEVEAQLSKKLKSSHSSTASPAVAPTEMPATASVPVVPTPTIPGLTVAQSAQIFAQEEARTSLMSLAMMQSRLLQSAFLSANPNAVPQNFPAGAANPMMMNPFLNPAAMDKSMQSMWYPALFPWSMFTSFPQLASYPVQPFVMPQANSSISTKRPYNKKPKLAKRPYGDVFPNDSNDTTNSSENMSDPTMNEPASILASLGSTDFNFGRIVPQSEASTPGVDASPLLGIINGSTVTA